MHKDKFCKKKKKFPYFTYPHRYLPRTVHTTKPYYVLLKLNYLNRNAIWNLINKL